ncbi:hypothetical protein ACET3Z_000128 [Daucus carota]
MKELLYVILFYQPCVEAFLDPDIDWPTRLKTRHDKSPLLAVLTRELLPIVKYSELVNPPENCAVCLHEFSDTEEIRKLTNCPHVFHRECVDRWMDHEQKTCPLCRTPFISDDVEEAYISSSTRLKTRQEMPTLLDILTRELLPVVKYSELVDPPQTCAVCLHDFSGCEKIRRLPNCQHVYHRNCVDRWMDHEQKTCPLCRTPFISDDMQAAFNERLWTASGISDFY